MSASITGIIKDKTGTVMANAGVVFKCLDGATVIVSGSVSIPPDISVNCDASGVLTATLVAGNYDVWVGGVKQFTIAVPSSGLSLPIDSLITSTVVPPPAAVASFPMIASDGSPVTVSVVALGGGVFSFSIVG